MAEGKLTAWYDSEGDYLELIFDQRPGCFRETENEQVVEKAADVGNLLGFSVRCVRALKEKPLKISL